MKIFLDANICLDLLDTTRPTASVSIAWYMQHKDNQKHRFFFSGDFITTFYYVLTQKRKVSPHLVIKAIDALCQEITPHYLLHNDFLLAQKSFFEDVLDDFEDLMILHSALRIESEIFLTNDTKVLKLEKFYDTKISSVS